MKVLLRLLAGTTFIVGSSVAQIPGYTLSTVIPSSSFSQSLRGMTVDSAGNVYIAAFSLVYKFSPSTGKTTIVAGGGPNTGFVGDGGPATSAVLSGAFDVAVDKSGNLYIADATQGRVRKVASDGTITTIAGPGSTNGALGDNGPAINANLNSPRGIDVDAAGNIYVADSDNNRIRRITPDGTITTVAGNGKIRFAGDPTGDGGPATSAPVYLPQSVKVDLSGNLFITSFGDSVVRKVTPAGIISTVAGNYNRAYSGDGGLATIAAINQPDDLAVDSSGALCIGDDGNGMIRLVTPAGSIFDIQNTGTANTFSWVGVAFGSGGKIYLSLGALYLLTPNGTTLTVPPSIVSGGIFGASAFGGFYNLAPGGWVEIYGSYLGTTSRSWAPSDFNGINAPTSLDGTSVKIGGQPAYISYVSPGQINAQVPSNIGTGQQPLVVTTKSGSSATWAVTVNPEQPGLLAPGSFHLGANSSGSGGYQYAVALFPDGATYVLPPGAIPGVPSQYAGAGDTITLYGVGFGIVSPNTSAGQIAQTTSSLSLPLHVYFTTYGSYNVEGAVTYAGLAPGAVGLYQINVVVPKLAVSGNPPVPAQMTFTLGGVAGGQSLYIAVH